MISKIIITGIALLGILISLLGCGMQTSPPSPCLEQDGNYVCGNYTFPIDSAVDGKDGLPGADGTPGVDGDDAVLAIIDPCGESNYADEVLLVLADQSVIAWYLGVGLYVIEDGKSYRTTDGQSCHFDVTDGIFSDESGQIVVLGDL